MQQIALIGNGDFVPCQALLPQYLQVIALDGGIRHCQQLNVTPNHWLGDGDSSTATELFERIVDQNTTDLDKGIAWVANHCAEPYVVDLFSVTSAERLDHTLAAIQHMARWPMIRTVYTPNQAIQLIRGQQDFTLIPGEEISLVSIGAEEAIIDLAGCQWSGSKLSLNTVSGISNRVTGHTVSIHVHQGLVLLIRQLQWTKL